MGVETVLAIGTVWVLAAGLAIAFGAAAKRGDARRAAKRGDARRAAIIARRMAQQPAPAAYESGRFERDRAPDHEPAGTSRSD